MPDPALLSNTIIGIQRETVRGTAPTTGVYAAVPFLDGISLSYESTPTEFDVYDGTRMKSFTVGGSRAVRLRIPTVLNYEQGQQDLLRAWLHAAAWAGGAIVADADPGYFFTIIAKLELAAGDDYLIFTGCEVASATMDMPLNDKVSVNYDIFGLGADCWQRNAWHGHDRHAYRQIAIHDRLCWRDSDVGWGASAWRIHGIAYARQSG